MIIFGSILTTLESNSIFGGSCGSNENWLEPKTKPPSVACPNLRNALFENWNTSENEGNLYLGSWLFKEIVDINERTAFRLIVSIEADLIYNFWEYVYLHYSIGALL